MSESTQTKLLSSVPAISSLAEGDKITVVTAAGQTALVSLSNLQSIMRAGMSAGRNLAKDSAYVMVGPSHGSHAVQTTDTLRPGDVITICADDIVITGEDSNNHNTVYVDIEDAISGSWITFVGLPRTKGVKATITLPTKSFTYNGVQIRICAKIYASDGVVKDTVKVYGLSVVRGSVAPLRWSPAPEDLNWGGVISSFSEASKASARISRKGGLPHEYIDNYADEGSHQCGAEESTVRYSYVEERGIRLGHKPLTGHLSCGQLDSEQAEHWHVWRLVGGRCRRHDIASTCCMGRSMRNKVLGIDNDTACMETTFHNAYHVALGKEVAA